MSILYQMDFEMIVALEIYVNISNFALPNSKKSSHFHSKSVNFKFFKDYDRCLKHDNQRFNTLSLFTKTTTTKQFIILDQLVNLMHFRRNARKDAFRLRRHAAIDRLCSPDDY